MSVGAHLGIDIAEYDRRIRSFIPGYETMLGTAAAALRPLGPRPRPLVIDLGIGTGALAARCLRVVPCARVFGIDEDAAMLEIAGRRLHRAQAAAVELRCGRFERVTWPRCDAVVASLALHHVRRLAAKRALYRRGFESLRSGGLLITADCMPPGDPRLARAARQAWVAHLERTYSSRQALAYLTAWAREDTYLPLPVEVAALEHAGFAVDVSWRRGMFAVVVARKRGREPGDPVAPTAYPDGTALVRRARRAGRTTAPRVRTTKAAESR